MDDRLMARASSARRTTPIANQTSKGSATMAKNLIPVVLYGLAAVGPVSAATLAPAPAVSAAISRPVDFKTQADAVLKAAFPADGPGAAVVVTRHGRVIYAAGRGLADLETGRLMTPDTVLKLGSITKQFTAAVILQLVAEGRISLDDPISRFFPGHPRPAADATVRQLLNHVSGIQDYTKIPGFMGGERTLRPITTPDLIAVIRERPSPSGPGERWDYNNSGYVILGAIIEAVTGNAWHEAVQERIAQPLGLKTIAYAGTAYITPTAARGYSGEGAERRPARGVHMSVAHAAGGLVGSAADLSRWAQALHGGRVVDPALYREMIRPARLADGATQPYGFGLRLRKLRGRAAFVHGGAGPGLDTDSVYIPSEALFVAVLVNSDDPATDPSTLTRRLAALALGEPFPTFKRADVALTTLEPLFGAYRAARGPAFRFLARDGKLYLAHGDNEMEAFAGGEDRFFFGPDALQWIRFVRQAGGAHVMEVNEPAAAQAERAVRTGPVPPPLTIASGLLQSYLGVYTTEGPVFTVALAENGGLTIAPAGQRALPMRPVAENEFRVDAAGFRIVFHSENGEVNRLTMYRGARELHGQRTGP